VNELGLAVYDPQSDYTQTDRQRKAAMVANLVTEAPNSRLVRDSFRHPRAVRTLRHTRDVRRRCQRQARGHVDR
jgi:hypothetical protein